MRVRPHSLGHERTISSGTPGRRRGGAGGGSGPSPAPWRMPGIPLQRHGSIGVLGADQHEGARPEQAGQVVRRAGDQVGAVLHHDDLVGEALGFEQEVGAHDHGAAVVGHLPDQVEHRVGGLGVEAGRRLVVEQQSGSWSTERARARRVFMPVE